MPKKILCLNEVYSDNIGDQAIAASAILILQKNSCRVDSYDFSFRNKNKERKTKHHVQNKKNVLRKNIAIIRLWFFLKNLPKAFRLGLSGYNSVYIGGGQLVLANATFPISNLLFCLIFYLFKIEVNYFGVGVGDKFSKFEIYILKFCLQNAKHIFVRDIHSKKNLKKIFDIHSIVYPDLVYRINVNEKLEANHTVTRIILCPAEHSACLQYKEETKQKFINEDDYIKFIQNLCFEIISTTPKQVQIIFSGSTKNDNKFIKKVFSTLPKKLLSVSSFEETVSYESFFRLLSTADIVVSSRMHPMIFAHILEKKIVPIIISNKIRQFSIEYLPTKAITIKSRLSRLEKKIERLNSI